MYTYHHKCPVCGNHFFVRPFEQCPICEWVNDEVQEEIPDLPRCGNHMSLDEAKKAYAEGIEIY